MREDIYTEDQEPLEPEQLSEEEAALEREAVLNKLNDLGRTLAKYREDAISGRYSSGIEVEWTEDEEAYEGIDNANREQVLSKPTSPDGGTTVRKDAPTRSTIFLNITRPYVDAAAAKIADMLLPTDDANFDMQPTPIPEIGLLKNDQTQLVSQNGNPLMKTMPGETEQTPFTVADKAAVIMSKAEEAVQKAKTRITDWQVECGYHDEFRRVIEDAAKIGVGILKGPFPISMKTKVVSKEGGMTQVEIVNKIQPASKRVDPWNFFPDPACGNSIHNGNYVWEREEMSGRALRDLLDDPLYIEESIVMALDEGPSKKKSGDRSYTSTLADKDTFEVWYYYGFVTAEDLEAAGCDCEEYDQTTTIPAVVVMVNDRVIRAMLSPQETGEFPFDPFVWQERVESWTGIGVARQIRTPQRMLNSAARSMMDNAGLSSGPQIVVRRNNITPADGQWTITPRKLWFATEEALDRPVSDSITSINIESKQVELMGIVQFAMKMAEDVTGLPMLLQGQQGKAPETVGGMQIMMTNASSVLRRLARNADSMLIKPHVSRYYDWLLADPDVPQEEKGDANIQAKGSTALVEREINNQILAQALQLSLNPAFGLSPERSLKEWLTGQRVNVSKIELTEEERQRAQQAAQQQPQDPRVISAQASVQTAQIRAEADIQKAKAGQDLSMQELQIRREEAAADREARMQELMLEREIQILKMANEQKVSLESIKAKLADTAMKERNKRSMFNDEMAVKRSQGSGI